MTGDRETAAVAGQSASDAATDLAPQGCARRAFILGAAGASLAAGGWISRAEPARGAESPRAVSPLFAYIGCFTSAQRNARAKGISVYRIDQSGTWTLAQTLETVPNPQFNRIRSAAEIPIFGSRRRHGRQFLRDRQAERHDYFSQQATNQR